MGQLRDMVPSLDLGFLLDEDFRQFFRFAFDFSREGTMKTIERDIIVSLLPLVIDDRSPFTASFLAFLGEDEGVNQVLYFFPFLTHVYLILLHPSLFTYIYLYLHLHLHLYIVLPYHKGSMG